MKIQILSDIHNEFEIYEPETCDADLVILAGDIHTKNRGIEWAQSRFSVPVLYVLGNHEAYGKTLPKYISEIRSLAEQTNVTILEKDVVTIGGVNFLGCTLWTDFEVMTNPRVAGYECQQVMTDYKKIKKLPNYSKIRSIDTALYNKLSVNWLGKTLSELRGQTNVVITHHGPSMRSVPAHKTEDITTSAYVSNLESFIGEHDIDYWVHGHLHNSSSYNIGSTTVICNPKGYPSEENPEFEPVKIISL
ncbi:MAG: Icc-related predicted phosphoesterase [Colwellia sp.]|jgi:Icc-related predicted phosphoesterase